MKITDEILDKLTALAKLELSPEERPGMVAELETILTYMDTLNTLNAEDILPPPTALSHIVREDHTQPFPDPRKLLRCAPHTDGETFLVPRAVDKEAHL